MDQAQTRGQPAQHPRPVRRHRARPARPPGPGAGRRGRPHRRHPHPGRVLAGGAGRRPTARLRQRAAPERRPAVVEAGRDRDSAAGAANHAREIAQTYLRQTGTLVESPPLFVAHVVQQANGNPQALADLLADASKERVVDKQRIRELRHAAGRALSRLHPGA
ncbi:MAG: hypothetical protein MZV65_46890 [Chromatiales bacterium]|nr:hypothetical protein [Chromatiales bacterium]